MFNPISAYEFYDLSDENRKKLVGTFFKEKKREHVYFPVQLKLSEFNYGIQQGLISLSPVWKCDEKWFKVGAFSPDDLDLDLEFAKMFHLTKIRRRVLSYMKHKLILQNRTYRGILLEIQSYFKCGEIFQ